MHRLHSGFTFAAIIRKHRTDDLRHVLQSLNAIKGPSGFDKDDTTLFVSGVILPEHREENLLETFVLATCYCGSLDNHLQSLVSSNRSSCLRMLNYCEGFDQSNPSDAEIIKYLKQNSHKGSFTSRYSGISKREVLMEKRLRQEIENYLDKIQDLLPLHELSAIEIRYLIQRHVKTCGTNFDCISKASRRSLRELVTLHRVDIATQAGILALAGLLIFFLGVASLVTRLIILGVIGLIALLVFLALQHITRIKYKTSERPSDDQVRKIAATQLHPVLNEMTASGPLKEGKLRRWVYKQVLKIVNFIGSDVPTVSHIRWLTIDSNKRLLFLSSYSNTTDFYVRDFLVGKTPLGVNFMFTNGVGFPDAKYLFRGGIVNDPEGYMNAVRSGQQVTDLWYNHELDLTADIINKNHRIRNGLFARMNEGEVREWLKLF